MSVGILHVFLPYLDPDESLAFYRDALGFEVREHVGLGSMRWLAVGPTDQPGLSIMLEPPAAELGVIDAERHTVLELMSKGCYARIDLATTDLDGTFARLESTGAEVLQEPIERAFGTRDCVFLDPAGTVVRIVESH